MEMIYSSNIQVLSFKIALRVLSEITFKLSKNKCRFNSISRNEKFVLTVISSCRSFFFILVFLSQPHGQGG